MLFGLIGIIVVSYLGTLEIFYSWVRNAQRVKVILLYIFIMSALCVFETRVFVTEWSKQPDFDTTSNFTILLATGAIGSFYTRIKSIK